MAAEPTMPTEAQWERVEELISNLSHEDLVKQLNDMLCNHAIGNRLVLLFEEQEKEEQRCAVDSVFHGLEDAQGVSDWLSMDPRAVDSWGRPIRRPVDLRRSCNPWVDLPMLEVHQPMFKIGNPCFTAPLRLKSFPNELLLCIAHFLPPESQVAFSMVDQHMMRLLGPRSLRLLRPEPILDPRGSIAPPTGDLKFKFLRLLERDCQHMVACPSCNILHHPVPDSEENRRKHITETTLSNFSHGLQPSVNYNVVRAIAKEQARGGGQWGMELLNAIEDTASVSFDGVAAIRTTNAKFVSGNLVLRSQIIVNTQMNPELDTGTDPHDWIPQGDISPRASAFVEDCLLRNRMCDHNDWYSYLRLILPQRHQFNERFVVRYDYAELSKEVIPVAAGKDCQVNPILREAFGIQPSFNSWSKCDHCATAFEFGVETIPNLGQVSVQTIWKNLGGPSDGDPYDEQNFGRFVWDSHRDEFSNFSQWLDPETQPSLQKLAGLPGSNETTRFDFEALVLGDESLYPDFATIEPHIIRKLLEIKENRPLNPDMEKVHTFFRH